MRLELLLNSAITYEQYWPVASNPSVIYICLLYWVTIGTEPFPAKQEDIADVEQAPAIVGIRVIEQAEMQSSAAVKWAYAAPRPQFAC